MAEVSTEFSQQTPIDLSDDLETNPVEFRPSRLLSLYKLLPAIILAAMWEFGAERLFDSSFVSQPSLIAVKLYQLVVTGVLARHFQTTVTEMAIGYFIGAVAGILLGFIFGRVRILGEIFEPYIMLFNGIPKVALAPMFIVWFGIGLGSKVAIVASMVFFLVFFNTLSGLNAVDEEQVGIVRLMGASPFQVMREVILPSAIPYIIIGLKTGVPYSVIGAMVGEFVAATQGIGYYISYAQGVFDTPGIFAGVTALVTLVLVLNNVLDRVERRLLSWKPKVEKIRVNA